MIAVRLYLKPQVTRMLHDAGCERIEEQVIPEHSYWKTQWGFHFFVPELGPDKACPAEVLHKILADVERSRPRK